MGDRTAGSIRMRAESSCRRGTLQARRRANSFVTSGYGGRAPKPSKLTVRVRFPSPPPPRGVGGPPVPGGPATPFSSGPTVGSGSPELYRLRSDKHVLEEYITHRPDVTWVRDGVADRDPTPGPASMTQQGTRAGQLRVHLACQLGRTFGHRFRQLEARPHHTGFTPASDAGTTAEDADPPAGRPRT
jgi:hypothetical protein